VLGAGYIGIAAAAGEVSKLASSAGWLGHPVVRPQLVGARSGRVEPIAEPASGVAERDTFDR
jgi:hypothetical protein